MVRGGEKNVGPRMRTTSFGSIRILDWRSSLVIRVVSLAPIPSQVQTSQKEYMSLYEAR